MGDLLAWLKRPVVLRVTPGVLALVAVMVLGLVLGSYGVGSYQGWKQGVADATQDGAGLLPGTFRPARQTEEHDGISLSPVFGPERETDGTPRDPRLEGLHYFILATTTNTPQKPYAAALLDFLAERGLDAAAIRAHNGELFQVIALRGFGPEERSSLAKAQYEAVLLRAGREWARRPGQRDLSDLYLDPKPFERREPPAEVLMKESLR